jgi:predicted CoA-binding protein
MKNIVILGASPKEERYSNQAVKMLLEYGYNSIPVNPAGVEIYGVFATKTLLDIQVLVDTLTIYVNSKISSNLTEEILKIKPNRVIFNPGTENAELEKLLESQNIKVIHACTLVLLRTGQFDKA